jgi:hypothetical protein
VNDGPMPPDPFSGSPGDWSQMASGLHGFFSAALVSGFTEGQALHLTSTALNTLLAVMLANAQPQPGT